MERTEIKTTSDGRKVEVRVSRYLDRATVDVYVDGQLIETHASLRKLPEAWKAKLPAGITHSIGLKVCITELEAATVSKILDEVQEIINQEPSVKMDGLITQRSLLVSAIRDAQEDRTDSSNRAWEKGDERGAFLSSAITKADDSQSAARAILAEFDRSNPDVLTEIKKRSEARTERFLAMD